MRLLLSSPWRSWVVQAAVHRFVVGDLCDRYIELAKPALSSTSGCTVEPLADSVVGNAAAAVGPSTVDAAQCKAALTGRSGAGWLVLVVQVGGLLTALEAALRLAHPLMPYATEELWQRLPKGGGGGGGRSIMMAAYPAGGAGGGLAGLRDPAAEAEMGLVLDVVDAVRSLRSQEGKAGLEHTAVLLQVAGNRNGCRGRAVMTSALHP